MNQEEQKLGKSWKMYKIRKGKQGKVAIKRRYFIMLLMSAA
jgi:hypothetical protein